MTKIIVGVIKTKRKFYFSFDVDSKIITIQPTKLKNNVSLFPEHDFKDYTYLKNVIDLEGETNDGVFIKFLKLKFSSIGRGCFQAWVPAYIKGLNTGFSPVVKPDRINEIIFSGECIDRFHSTKASVKREWNDEEKKVFFEIGYGEDKIIKFKYDKYDCELIPAFSTPPIFKDVKTIVTTNTKLKVKSEKYLKPDKILDIYMDFEKLFSFICYRQHIDFSNIILCGKYPIQYDREVRSQIFEFELCISNDDTIHDLPAIDKTIVLNNKNVDKIASLIQSIKTDSFMLLSFPMNSMDVKKVDNYSYVGVATSFEAEFNLMFPKYKSDKSKEYKEVKNITLSFIESQLVETGKYNRKKRDYFSDFYRVIEINEGTLQDKMQFALEKYEYLIKDDVCYYTKLYDLKSLSLIDISKAFCTKRNELTHGVKLDSFKKIELASYVIIRKLIVAMILERSGFEKEDIIKNVNILL